MLKLGEVKAPTDQDYEYIKELCRNEENWKLDYNKSNIKVWVKQNNLSVFNMIKAKVEFDDVVPERLFDVLLDGDYGKQWDDGMIDGALIILFLLLKLLAIIFIFSDHCLLHFAI